MARCVETDQNWYHNLLNHICVNPYHKSGVFSGILKSSFSRQFRRVEVRRLVQLTYRFPIQRTYVRNDTLFFSTEILSRNIISEGHYITIEVTQNSEFVLENTDSVRINVWKLKKNVEFSTWTEKFFDWFSCFWDFYFFGNDWTQKYILIWEYSSRIKKDFRKILFVSWKRNQYFKRY